jgi:hypothetical protein
MSDFTLAEQGPFSNRSSSVKLPLSPARVTVLSAVGARRRNIWFGPEARALQGPQRADVQSRAHGPDHAVTCTLAQGRHVRP